MILLESSAKASPENRAEAAAKAEAVRQGALAETKGQLHLGALAQQHSADPATRYRGGDFGMLKMAEVEGRYGPALARALAALVLPGEISPVLETPAGPGFVKLVERRAEARRPLAEVRELIAHQLTQARQAQAERDLVAAAKGRAGIRLHRAVIDSVPLGEPSQEPPSLPGVQTFSQRDPL